MTYNKKVKVLLSAIVVLALTYTASFIFSPERSNTRSASYLWLDPKLAGSITRIVMSTGEDPYGVGHMLDEEMRINMSEFLEPVVFELHKRNQSWFIKYNDREFPAKQARIDDLISIFTTRSLWPVRSTNAASHARFDLEGKTSSRITFFGDNSSLLDVLVGGFDPSGYEIYLRKFAQNEVRSGDNSIYTYIYSEPETWYNLKLFPESENRNLDVSDVQRFSLFNEGETIVFSRSNREWIVSGIEMENPGNVAIENYIRIVLTSEGDAFENHVFPGNPVLDYSRIIIEFGDGSIRTVRVSAANDENRRLVHISGAVNSEYVYSIPLWVSLRMLRTAESFSGISN